MNKKNRVINLILSFIMVIGMLGGINITKDAMAATGLNMAGTTIKMYPYSNSNFALYDRTSGNKKKIGTCYGKSDQITIRAVGTDGWSTVTIPVTGTTRTKTGYCLTSYLFENINFAGATGIVQGSGITTYRKYDCKTTYGTAAKNDRVFILGYASGNTQILYPCGSYYKAAWIKGRYVFSNGKLQKANSANTTVGIKQPTTIPDGYYRIRSSINNVQVFDIDRGSKADCANLQISQYNGGENQLFYLSKNKDGYYIIRVVHSNLVLDVYLNVKGNGANIVQSRYHGGANQQWKIYKTSDGKYLFQSRSNGLFMDVSGGIAVSGQNIQCYTDNNTSAQKFSLQCVNYSNTGNAGNNTNTNSNRCSYAPYTGVSYNNAGISKARIAALDKARAMVTVLWKAPCDFPAWQSASGSYNYVCSTDGTRSTKYIKGKTYMGIPYSMADNTYDDTKWISRLNSGISSNYMTGTYLSRKRTTAHGIDCSYFTYVAFKSAGTRYNISYQQTSVMLNSSTYVRKTLSNIKPADIALKNGHVMLYVGRVGSNYAFFEADASDSKCSYNVYSAAGLNKSGFKIYKFRGFSD